MGAEATGLDGNMALPLVLVRSRADDGAAQGSTTPSLHTPVTVPFLWEDAPGKPKLPPHTGTAVQAPAAAVPCMAGGDHSQGDAKAHHLMPLKLPPRLQVLPSTTAADGSLSPKTVLHGPYGYGCTGGSARRRPPPRRVASFRRTPSPAGGFFFSRRMKAVDKKKGDRDLDSAVPDTSSSSSPSPSSSSSSSASIFGDDSRRHGARRRTGDEKRADPAEEVDDGSVMGLVRITRFRRNSSLPSMTTSHFWASIRKSVKQIAPWT